MCFSKADGGIRCYLYPKMARSEQRFMETQEQLDRVRSALNEIKNGAGQAKVNGKYRRKESLIREGAKLSATAGRLFVETSEIQRHWEMSSKGLADLKDRSEDTSLTIAQRKHYDALASVREKERVRTLEALDTKKLTERNLQSIMAKDGFDQATIDECNIPISVNKYPRTSKEYKKRIHKAVNEMQALEVQRMDALRTCKHEDRSTVEAEYAGKLSVVNIERLEAQYGYESTVEGLASLKDEAEDRSIRMTQVQRQTKMERYRKAQERHDGDKRDRNNRDNRRNAIKRAYKEKGLDATNALNAHKHVVTPTGNKSATNGSTATNANIRRTVLLTASESTQVEADFRASGARSYSAYLRAKVMGAPTANIQDKSLRKLHQEAEQFSDGEAHRQRTTRAGKRNIGNDTKLNAQENEKLTARAKSFHMSRSSYMRMMLLGLDPRQIQNDRSELTNDIKTAMMEDLQRKSA